MGPFEAIIILTLVGFLCLAAEVFVPGLVLGIIGCLCLIGAVVAAFVQYGPLTGAIVFAAVSAFSLIGFMAWMFAFPHTAIGRRIMLQKSLNRGESQQTTRQELLGQEGRALTILRPAGSALLAGRKVDVVAESDFIAPGEPVVVVREEGLRIVVRKKV